ncbi:uncharacterized protein LOC107861920 isoform X4 [Capsicum annuum]|uniref:uncharacterized protein LOC107861920 isoform X4 n=2 Tax=Capsicum annuum TaxID=4072 RepID=UPI001FB145CD|nr:uncharacterized protein LOC107861920 isoform X4 [Capsicum annuum]
MTNGIVGPQAGGIFMNQLPLVDCKEYWQSFGFGSPVPSIAQTDKDAAITLHQRSTNFIVLAILTLVLKGSWYFRQVVLSLFVVIWGLRLGLFLLMRILQWGEDRRFDDKRDNLGKLAIFWILQAQDIIGWIMWIIGILVEITADQQKLAFKNSPENRGKWCSVGLWKYSRHPNYFGEILLWWGFFLASTPVLEGAEWLVMFGPVFITLLLLFVSGIPLLEASADKKFGNVAAYRSYKRKTSPLILLPPGMYGSLPQWLKGILLFEFPLYSRNLPQEELSWNRRSQQGSSGTDPKTS